MDLTPHTYRFLKINGIIFMILFFVFGIALLVSSVKVVDPTTRAASLVIGVLLTTAAVIVTSLHWLLHAAVKTGAIIVRNKRRVQQ